VELRPLIGLLYLPWMIDGDCGAIGWMNDWQGKLKYSEKSRPSAALFTTNPTWLNLGHHSGKAVPQLCHNPYIACVSCWLSYNSSNILHYLKYFINYISIW
jgi:hypothetical protein